VVAGTGELTSRRLLALFEGLPATCRTMVELGADPCTLELHLLRRIEYNTHRVYAVLHDVYRDREETRPYPIVEPVPLPERELTPERLAERERAEAEAAADAKRLEMASYAGHDVSMGILSGETTMEEISLRIQAQMTEGVMS
jgi:hypothetical protein